MTTAVPSRTSQNGHQPNYDGPVRAYLLSLKRGQMSDIRPECGPFWEHDVSELERLYRKADGNLPAYLRAVAGYCKDKPALVDLLRESEPTLARDEGVNGLGVPKLPQEAWLDPRLSTGACLWLDDYEAYSRRASPESYEHFHIFGGLWLLSTVAARRVYLPFSRKRFTTNLMIVFCSETSLFVKSGPADIAKELLEEAGLDFFLRSDRISPQKLLSTMAGKLYPANYDDMTADEQRQAEHNLAMPGQVGLFQDEFGKFVRGMLRRGSTNSDFVDIFLKLDSCPKTYGGNDTIMRGAEPISRPHLALLGNMTPPDLKENARAGADFWTDGFWARFAFVCAPEPTEENVTIQPFGREELPIPRPLVTKIQEWHTHLGVPECHLEPILKNDELTGKYRIVREDLPETACTIDKDAYEAWARYYTALKRMCLKFKKRDLNGSYARLAEKALRMAILMASLENDNHITIRHWAKAQELAELLRRNLHELYAQVNSSSEQESAGSKLEDEIEKHLSKHGALTLNTLRGSYMPRYSSKQLEDVLNSMIRAGRVEKFKTSHAKAGKYKLVEQTDDMEVEDDATDTDDTDITISEALSF